MEIVQKHCGDNIGIGFGNEEGGLYGIRFSRQEKWYNILAVFQNETVMIILRE